MGAVHPTTLGRMKIFDQTSWVRGVVGKLTARWKRGPRVEVVASPWDLPVPNAPMDTAGLYTPRTGTVHVIAHQPAWRVAPVLSHEAIGHHSMRVLLRSKWTSFMAGLHSGMRDKRERPLQRLVKRIKKNYAGSDGRCRLSRLQLADEVAAHVVEDATCPHTGALGWRGRMKERWSNVRRMIHREKPGRLKLGFKHLVATLREAARRLTDRYRRVGVTTGRSKFRPRSKLQTPKWKRARAQS